MPPHTRTYDLILVFSNKFEIIIVQEKISKENLDSDANNSTSINERLPLILNHWTRKEIKELDHIALGI